MVKKEPPKPPSKPISGSHAHDDWERKKWATELDEEATTVATAPPPKPMPRSKPTMPKLTTPPRPLTSKPGKPVQLTFLDMLEGEGEVPPRPTGKPR